MTESTMGDYTLFRFASSSKRKASTQKSWTKRKINKIILNYFIQEGFQTAAVSLSEEADVALLPRYAGAKSTGSASPTPPATAVKGFSSIEKRKVIKYLILKGNVSEAIKAISLFFPTVLDANNLLFFKLLRLNLIEMIRNHKFSPESPEMSEREFLDSILTFVRENLINKVTHSLELLKELEVTMSLLCFNFDPLKPSSQLTELPEDLRRFFDLSLRIDSYRAINKAILDSESIEPSEARYSGPSFAEIDLSQDDSLVDEPRDLENTQMMELDAVGDEDITSAIEAMIAFAPNPTTEPPLETTSQPTASEAKKTPFRSQLEEIARLWIATELVLLQKGLLSKKVYFPDHGNNAYL